MVTVFIMKSFWKMVLNGGAVSSGTAPPVF